MKVAKTLYATQEFQQNLSLDEDTEKDLIEAFSNRPPPKKVETEEEKRKKEEEAQKKSGILDQKRTMNILIMLRKFKCSPRAIAEAVHSLDPLSEVLSQENIQALFLNSFKEHELAMAKDFAAPQEEIEQLNIAEALAYHIARVPRWNIKIKSMIAMRTSEEVASEIRTSLQFVIDASKQVLASKRLHRILATVLAIGNILNAGTAKGSARGFRLDTLTRLQETRTKEREISLLDFITRHAEEKTPDAMLFPEDMPSIPKAKRIAKEDIAKELSTFQAAVVMLGREITATMKEEEKNGNGGNVSLPRTPPPPRSSSRVSHLSDLDKKVESNVKKSSALGVAKDLYNRSESQVTELQKLQEEMLRCFSEMAVRLGEDPKNAKVEEVFSILSNFMDAFQKSVKENSKRREDTARKERLAKRHAADQERRNHRASLKAQEKEGPKGEHKDDKQNGQGADKGISPVSVNEDRRKKIAVSPNKSENGD